MSDKPVVRRASPLFCYLILVGLILVWISLILWTGPQTTFSCNAKLWFALVGYALFMRYVLSP